MINFKAKHMIDRGYSLHIPGNGGEEELVIFTAWGQDHKTNLVIVSASIDGGDIKVWHDTHGKRIILASVLTLCDRVIDKWSMSGLKPSVDQKARLVKHRTKVLDRIAKLYDGCVEEHVMLKDAA